MNSVGEVIKIEGNLATVRFKRAKACKNCSACISFSSDELLTELENTLGAEVGDKVEIQLHSRSVVKASLIMYGIPLCALLAGVCVGSLISELACALMGIGLAAVSFLILHLFEPRFERMSEFTPKMTSIVD